MSQPSRPITAGATAIRQSGDAAAGFAMPAILPRETAAFSYVPEVDALRGLAMTGVIVFHCGLLPFGWMGVWVFFVVSGFAVTTSLIASQQHSHSTLGTIWHFYVRRAIRIWPLYFAFLAVNVLVLAMLGMMRPLADLPWLVTFSYNIRMIFETYTPGSQWVGFGHLWTLSVEQQFYFLFPWVMVLRPGTQRRILMGVVLAAPFLRAAVAVWGANQGWAPIKIAFAVYAFAPAHFDAFAAGALIAMFRGEILGNVRLAHLALLLAVCVGLSHIAVYLTIGIWQAGHMSIDAMRNIVSGIEYGQGREVSVYLIPTCLTCAILIGILARQRWCLSLCGLPGLQAAGRISYGGYLLHVPALMVVGLAIHSVFGPQTGLDAILCRFLLLSLGLPLTLASGWISFTYFEQRFMRARRKYG